MKNTITLESVEILSEACKLDYLDLKLIEQAITIFSEYHKSIIYENAYYRIFSNSDMPGVDFQTEHHQRDEMRANRHNEVITYVCILNKLAKLKGLQPTYAGIISRDQPYRREVANAVLELIQELIISRS
jgi:hypothetical protein